jgi:hypothetical protein
MMNKIGAKLFQKGSRWIYVPTRSRYADIKLNVYHEITREPHISKKDDVNVISFDRIGYRGALEGNVRCFRSNEFLKVFSRVPAEDIPYKEFRTPALRSLIRMGHLDLIKELLIELDI